jgi:ribonuclease D
MQEHKNVWVDGSLRDSGWYKEVFAKIRRDHPHYRIAILHVSASWETVKARAESRALKTGRVVPEADLRASFEQVPASVSALSPLADFCAHIDNEGTPTLSQTCQAGECESNATGTWDEVRNRFAAIRKLPLQA